MKKSNSKPKFLAEVEWLDANTTTVGECLTVSKAKLQEASKRISIGYLLLINDDKIVIAGTYDPGEETEDEVSEVTVIPAAWVCKIKRFNV